MQKRRKMMLELKGHIIERKIFLKNCVLIQLTKV